MPVLNADTLATFKDFMQPDELQDFLGRVRQELSTAWPRLEASLQAQDWPAAQKDAHRLKGVVGSVGCDALYEALHQLENGFRAQPAQLPGDAQVAQLRAAVKDADLALLEATAQT